MLAFLEDARALPWLRRVTTGVLVAGLVACASEAGSGPADPTLLPEGVTLAPVVTRTPLPGFGDVIVEVTKVDGEVVAWCLLLAESEDQHQRGLMTVTDPALGGYDGMLFRFGSPNDVGFWMRNTPLPLSIAYVGEDGGLVSSTEMAPCEDSQDCPPYPPSGPYRWAVEVPVAEGGVAGLGLVAGARLRDTGQACSTA